MIRRALLQQLMALTVGVALVPLLEDRKAKAAANLKAMCIRYYIGIPQGRIGIAESMMRPDELRRWHERQEAWQQEREAEKEAYLAAVAHYHNEFG